MAYTYYNNYINYYCLFFYRDLYQKMALYINFALSIPDIVLYGERKGA